MKSFFKIFAFLFITEIALHILAIFLMRVININILSTIGHYIMLIISLPISFIDRSYPFYAPVPLYKALLLVAVNVATHALLFKLIFKK